MENIVLRNIRILIITFSLYVTTHLFSFVALPLVLFMSYLFPNSIPKQRRWFVNSIFSIIGKKVEIHGLENYNPNKIYIIVSNYPSGYAGFALIGLFNHASIVAHSFLQNIPIVSHVLGRIGVVYANAVNIDSDNQDFNSSLEKSGNITSLIIFPEGGITRDGKIHRFRRGFVHIQRKTAFEILPVTLNGFYQLKPFGRLFADPDATPKIYIHPPISQPEAFKVSDKVLIHSITKVIGEVYVP